MEVICDLGDLEDDNYISENTENYLYNFSELSLIPKVGVYLGLDISESSSGICMYRDGVKETANATLLSKEGDFLEVRLRRELKECLTEMIKGIDFDLIIIEDAFQGVNPSVTRKLYAINTAIDELILDGVCKCKDFRRINNQLWKSWLFKVDTEGLYKGMEDKLRIEKCLGLLGVYEDHKIEGWQDRLDACGMLLGYFLCKDEADFYEERKAKKRVSMDDVRIAYEVEQDFCLMGAGYGSRDINVLYIDEKNMSKKLMLNYLTDYPNMVCMTSKKVKLGMFGGLFDLTSIEGGGYFAFWIDEKRLSKYLE